MSFKRAIMISTVLLLLSVLASCSGSKSADDKQKVIDENLQNVNETGFPIVDEKITIDMFVPVDPDGYKYWDDLIVWEEYEKQTNIEVKWDKAQSAALEEKRNLALGSGTLPDVFYASGLPVMDILKHGQQGTFIELNDLIEEYAPNLSKLMEEYPEIRKSLTFPNGKIYSMPTLMAPDALSLRIGARPFINEKWLEKLEMENPETTDELYQFLKGVQETDLIGDGKDSEVPLGARNMDDVVDWMRGAFGLGNQGHPYLDLDPETNEMRFIPISDEYKEMIEYLHMLYSEELIEQNIFSIESNQYRSNGTSGIYGTTMYYDPTLLLGEGGQDFIGANALEGPYGDKAFVAVTPLVTGFGAFVITNENENPAATIRWMDHFYGEEGMKLIFMGVEGETYTEKEDGSFEYVDKIMNSSEGLTMDQELAKYVPWASIFAPAMFKQDYFKGSESSPLSLETAEQLKPYLPDEIWPDFTYTEEENKQLESLEADIIKYADENRDKFIAGTLALSEWDSYVDTVQKMGLDRYMEIQKEAYERYRKQ